MKDFWKMTGAVILGIIILSFVSIFLMISSLGAIMAAGSAQPQLPRSGVLVMDMSKLTVAEQAVESNPVESIYTGEETATVGLWEAVQAINAAAGDPSVKFIYLKTDNSLTSIATLEELRHSLGKFRESGKPVVSYIEAPTTGTYYLASVADKVYMTSHPGATTMVNGVGSQMIFLGDLLDKLGVNVQLIRHGKYKSAGEMFTRNSASEENLEQYQQMVSSMWASMAGEIAASRGISEEALNEAVDGLKLCIPADFVECGLVDELLSSEQLEEKLTTFAMEKDYKDVKGIPFADYVAARVLPSKSRNKIAVIYADGEIIDGSVKQQVAGDRFASIVRKVADDSSVKSVVLRVNSPGGSVLASEKIKDELDRLAAKKPLVASYGDMAASGGYWISAACEKIFTDKVTLTGSIGVFGMIPDFSKTLKDVAHVNIQSVTSNKHGDMYALTRPFDQAEHDYMLRSIEDIYTRFTNLVSEARDMSVEQVDGIGQGRVWTGSDAIGINLADEIGTLEDAIAYAAVAAGDSDLAKWNVKSYPKPASMMDQLLEGLTGTKDTEEIFAGQIRDLSSIRMEARLPYEIRLSY